MTTISKSIHIAATKAVVWSYLTEADKLGTWFHAPKANLTEGADYALLGADSGDTLCFGKVLRMQPHDEMEWTFSVRPAPDVVGKVLWKLTETPGGTQLTLTHTGLPDGAEAYGLVLALDAGWHDHLRRLIDAAARVPVDA